MEYVLGIGGLSIGGCVFLFVGLHTLKSNRKIKNKGFKTRATIIDLEESRIQNANGNWSTYSFPILTFTDQRGEKITRKMNFADAQKISKSK